MTSSTRRRDRGASSRSWASVLVILLVAAVVLGTVQAILG